MVKSPVLEKQKADLEKEALGIRIFDGARNELGLNLRYLDLALGSLPAVPGGAEPAGTDGAVLEFEPEGVMRLYLKGREYTARLYLHSIFHCILGHPFDRKERDPRLWNLACDIAVEALIDSLHLKCVHVKTGAFRKGVYARLRGSLRVLTAEGIYRELVKMQPDDGALSRRAEEFRLDSHSLWEKNRDPDTGGQGISPNQQRWEDIRDRMETELDMFSREASEGDGNLLEQLKVSRHSRYDYREFLRKFMVLREEMQIDPDSFDYIFYSYGMTLYGNVPLIEPQETCEIKGIEDFVIVIDTSMSCSGELVHRFLEETLDVLEEERSFFKHFRIHIIQCDEKVQSDVLVRSHEEMEAYMRGFSVKGGGGTDFRPAFMYVDRMLAEKEFRELKGLLYFTDGYGIFPVKMPRYETAFVFIRDHFQDVDVPPWAVKLVLDEKDML